MDVISRVKSFVSFWYQRYLLATELYMVEPWEKVVVHVIFILLFWLFWYFNFNFVVTLVAQLRSSNTPYTELVN